ncbi:unnamed protein product [Prunus brigantina]
MGDCSLLFASSLQACQEGKQNRQARSPRQDRRSLPIQFRSRIQFNSDTERQRDSHSDC